MDTRTPIRILMIGPHQRKGRPFGGDVVSFELLIECLRNRNDVVVNSISTLRPRSFFFLRLFSACLTLLRILFQTPRHDILVLFVNNHSLYQVTPVLASLAILFGKPLILKKIGGNDHLKNLQGETLSDAKIDRLHRYFRKVSLYMPQTHHAVKVGREHGIPSIWLPGYRKMTAREKPAGYNRPCRNFVYIGRVIPEKGMREIIAADKLYDNRVRIDVYGPLDNGMKTADFEHLEHVTYKGPLKPNQVSSTLEQYDAYVFPTYWRSEGHPGSLIEAFSQGLPAVSTNMACVTEIADESNSVIIEAKNPKMLAEGVNRLAEDDELFHRLAKGALKKSRFFDVEFWQEMFVDCCKRLVRKDEIPKNYFNIDEDFKDE